MLKPFFIYLNEHFQFYKGTKEAKHILVFFFSAAVVHLHIQDLGGKLPAYLIRVCKIMLHVVLLSWGISPAST